MNIQQRTIYDSLYSAGFQLKRHTGDIGLELETETIKPYEPPAQKFWSNLRDNSLRDFGVEYILKAPTARGMETRLALEEWDSKVRRQYPLKSDSYSTSVHVHLNFLNNTWRQMINFLVTYYLLENLLIRFSGPDRRSNLFCLPICDAEGELEAIFSLVRILGTYQYRKIAFNPELYKYSAMNICNISKLGTLESRSMRGVTDIKIISQWIDMLLAIKDFSELQGMNPLRILEVYEKEGPVRFAEGILGTANIKTIDSIIDKNKENISQLVEQNLWYAAKIATSAKFDDENWGFPKPKKIYREKYNSRLEQYSNDLFKKPYSALEYGMRIVVEESVLRELGSNRDNVIFQDGDI
jgi:hypothetical protein